MQTNPLPYRAALSVTIIASLILIWLTLGVGIIGADGDRANMMYGAVIVAGIIGAAIARLRPHGMAQTLFAMALVQALIAAVALIAGLGGAASPPLEIILLNGFFVALFVSAALLFRRSARP